MLYGNKSISYYSFSNVFIWMTMAFQAGLINIGGVLAGHRIVSHVTGFATLFGIEANKVEGNPWGMLFIPFFFFLGACVSGYFVDIRLKLQKNPKYFITFGIMFFLLFITWLLGWLGYFGPFGKDSTELEGFALLALLSLICGIQNGTISTVSRSIVRTTHLTGLTTDLGLGFVRVLNRKSLPRDGAREGRANLMRIGIIIFFILGSVAGGLIFYHLEFHGFLIPTLISAVLFILMFYFQKIQNQPSSSENNEIV